MPPIMYILMSCSEAQGFSNLFQETSPALPDVYFSVGCSEREGPDECPAQFYCFGLSAEAGSL